MTPAKGFGLILCVSRAIRKLAKLPFVAFQWTSGRRHRSYSKAQYFAERQDLQKFLYAGAKTSATKDSSVVEVVFLDDRTS